MSEDRRSFRKGLWAGFGGRGKSVKKEKKADRLKPADSIITLNDMWEAEKKRRQLEEQGHLQKLNKTGGNYPGGARGRSGVSFTGAGGTPYSVQRDLLGRGGPVLVRDLQAARLREASERAAFRALRVEENRMAQKESEAKGDWMFHHYREIEAQRLKNQEIRIEQAKQNYLKEQEVKQKAIELRNLKAGVNPPGSAAVGAAPGKLAGATSNGRAPSGSAPVATDGRGTPTGAAPGKPVASKPAKSTYVNWMKPGAPGARIGGSGTDTVEGIAQSRVDPGKSTGVAVVRGGPGSDTVAAIVERQMRRSIETGGKNPSIGRRDRHDVDFDATLEEIDRNAPVAAYKGGKARRRARLQVLSRR